MRWTLLSPGDPTQRTGGYLYNARLVTALRERGHRVDVLKIDGDWPMGPVHAVPDLPHEGLLLADGLLWTALRPQLTRDQVERSVVVVHSVLAAEGEAHWAELEARALRGVRQVVSTGGPTERDLARLGVPSVRIEPGTTPAPRRRGPGRGRLLALGTVTPRKRQLQLLHLQSWGTPESASVGSSQRPHRQRHQNFARFHQAPGHTWKRALST